MLLVELGAALREERTRCGYSIAEVASKLKITSRVIQSIESGDVAGLPHAVYASGFIRAYAALVGIPEDDVRPALLELTPGEQNVLPLPAIDPSYAPKKSLRWIFWGALVLALLIGAGYATDMFTKLPDFLQSSQSLSPQTTQPANEQPLKEQPKGQPANAQTLHDQPAVAQDHTEQEAREETPPSAALDATTTQRPQEEAKKDLIPAETQPNLGAVSIAAPPLVQNPAQDETPEPDSMTLQKASMEQAPSSLTAETPPSEPVQHQVTLAGLDSCWVHSTADDTDIREFSIQKGDVLVLPFTKQLVLKLGNAQGVQIAYNGNPLSISSEDGPVQTLTFPPSS